MSMISRGGGRRLRCAAVLFGLMAAVGFGSALRAQELDEIQLPPATADSGRVHVLVYPTTSTSVPFIGAPSLWENNIGLPSTLTGAGIKVGIIDTGLDYLHADFGGTGLLADYQTESTSSSGFTTTGSFPTAKVVG